MIFPTHLSANIFAGGLILDPAQTSLWILTDALCDNNDQFWLLARYFQIDKHTSKLLKCESLETMLSMLRCSSPKSPV